jgi:hypothetical protein
MLARKIALSLLSLIVAFIVMLTTAYSFGLGQSLQNLLMIVDGILLLVWLWLSWRGEWVWALSGILVTFIIGVGVIPFLSR